jgi:hypothetical protein
MATRIFWGVVSVVVVGVPLFALFAGFLYVVLGGNLGPWGFD